MLWSLVFLKPSLNTSFHFRKSSLWQRQIRQEMLEVSFPTRWALHCAGATWLWLVWETRVSSLLDLNLINIWNKFYLCRWAPRGQKPCRLTPRLECPVSSNWHTQHLKDVQWGVVVEDWGPGFWIVLCKLIDSWRVLGPGFNWSKNSVCQLVSENIFPSSKPTLLCSANLISALPAAPG